MSVVDRNSHQELQKLRREEFVFTEEKAWFDTSTYGPLPTSSVRVQKDFLDEQMRGIVPKGVGHWWEGAAKVRGKVGTLIKCDPQDVALLHSTGEGLGLVSLGLDWKSGDEVIIYDNEFPSVVYPWLALGKRGVVTRFIEDRGRHRFDVEDVEALLSDRTRVVCVSLVNCYHGFRAPIEEIAKLCHSRGVWLLVDAIQAVGALTVDIGSLGADLVTAGGYKYLCSGFGISFCFVSPNLRESLEVSAPGWKSIKDAPFVEKQMQYNLRYPSDARRYEAAIPNLVGMYGLGATIDLFTNTGIQLINDWVLEISAGVAEVLEESGYVIANSIRDGERSGIVSAEVPGGDVKRVFEILAEQNIICAVRDNRLRFSCHVFNDWTDIERLASALPTP